MTVNFRKIPAKDFHFKVVKRRLIKDLEAYIEYIANFTDTTQKSGKKLSYANYLIRLIILAEEAYNIQIDSLYTAETYYYVNQIKKDYYEEFVKYNLDEARFPNASLKQYNAFYSYYYDFIDELNQINHQNSIVEQDLDSLPNGPISLKLLDPKEIAVFARNKNFSEVAKRQAQWQCEVNLNHSTFIMESGVPYMESHHLLPMYTQIYYKYSVDFPDNIVCLCPNCHRKLHYGLYKEKIELIEKLYSSRKDKYKQFGIDLTLKELLEYYK
ncbi:hypothetical protein WJ437_02700 [Ignavigranum ruoffiae]|uniref:HNH endonuclease n=1 Tax=Ignavigranum ruoffiae TaxID=89093 RepID=UPI003AFF7A8E